MSNEEVGAQDDSVTATTTPSEDVEPRDTDHPAGKQQAEENQADESPS